jgi:uncharacterized protein
VIVGLPLILLFLVASMTCGAAVIRGLTGFGMAIILVPLLGMVMDPGHAVVLAILLQLFVGPVGLRTILADADRASAVPIALIAMATTPVGLWLLARTDAGIARLLIALIAVAAFLLVLLPPRRDGSMPGRALTIGTGVASGVLTGFAAMPGPPVIPYYLRQSLPPVRVRASMMLIFFATAIAGSMSAALFGRIDRATLVLALILFPAVLLGNWLGGLAFGRVPAPLWRAIVALILGIAAVSAVLRLD